MARENLAYYDQFLSVSRDRLSAGDISQVDLSVWSCSAFNTKATCKPPKSTRVPPRFSCCSCSIRGLPSTSSTWLGRSDFSETVLDLEELPADRTRIKTGFDGGCAGGGKSADRPPAGNRNGSSDPIFTGCRPQSSDSGLYRSERLRSVEHLRPKSGREGADRNRNTTRTEGAGNATGQALADVDSALATLNGSLNLLRPYKSKYLDEAAKVREYDYVLISKRRLIAAGISNRTKRIPQSADELSESGGLLFAAGNQLNLATGREVIP